jgi:phosphate-selective porin OprO/OprP
MKSTPNLMNSSVASKLRVASLAALALAAFAAPSVRADDSGQIKQLQDQIQALQNQLNIIARKQEISDDSAAAAAKVQPTTSFGDNGFTYASADGANSFHLGTLIQVDSREFLGDGGGVLNNGLFLRRARIVLDGKFDKIYSYQFVPDFGNGSAGTATTPVILDANLTIAPTQELQFKIGKYKDPIGLEELQNDQYTAFVERSLVSDLEPSRDLGVEALGNLDGGTINYGLGVFNGTPDNLTSSGNSDYDNDKDVVARLFFQPWLTDKDSDLQGLGFGVAGGLGREKTHSGVTAGYKTDGQQTWFTYNAAVYADGDTWRFSPQAYYYVGPFGLLGETVVSTINARPTAPTGAIFTPKVEVENRASALTASYVLTGEDGTYTGVTPAQPFSWSGKTWGAWQVVARWEELRIDRNAFKGTSPLASPITNADEATSIGGGLNWYLTKSIRISQDFFDTRFGVLTRTAATPQILQHNEKALTTRVQLSF